MQLIEPTTPLIFLPQCAYRYRPIIFVGKLFLIIEFIQEVSKSQSKKKSIESAATANGLAI